MEKFLEEILKSDILSEDNKVKMREQFTVFVEGVRDQARKDVAEQYKRDREKLINATDRLIREGLQTHIKEFKQEFDHLERLKDKASKSIVEANKKADAKVSKALRLLETSMKSTMANEMNDLLEDRRLERVAVANTIKESKERAERDRAEFVKKGAKMIDFIIEKEVKKLVTSLHKDIIAARQNNFGRKIFEAYHAEFEASMFSHDAHAKKLKAKNEIIEAKYGKLKEAAKTEITNLRKGLSEAQRTATTLTESAKKAEKTSKLLRSLKGEAREQMKELLEAAPYAKLDVTFKKFLPVVTESKKPAAKNTKPLSSFQSGDKRPLNESRQPKVAPADDIDDDLIALRRKAGIS